MVNLENHGWTAAEIAALKRITAERRKAILDALDTVEVTAPWLPEWDEEEGH